MKRLLFVTGRPGIGKTTVIIEAVNGLKQRGYIVGGMISREVRHEGARVGFEVADLESGAKGWLAHVDQHEGPQVGKYRINLADFESVGVRAIRNALLRSQVVIIDEIGPMELSSNAFIQIVKDALNSRKPILGVIHRNARDPVVEAIRRRNDIEISPVTFQNRGSLHNALIEKAVQYINQAKL